MLVAHEIGYGTGRGDKYHGPVPPTGLWGFDGEQGKGIHFGEMVASHAQIWKKMMNQS